MNSKERFVGVGRLARNLFPLLAALLLLSGPAIAADFTLSGTITNVETSEAAPGASVGVTRVSALGSGNPEDSIPLETQFTTDANGQYQLSVSDTVPGLDRLLVFTTDILFVNELYDGVAFAGRRPTFADIGQPGVVEVNLTLNPTGIDFALAPDEGNKTTHMLEMSDGVRLATDVYLPDGPGPWPTVLYRTPYGRVTDYPALSWLDQGYAIVAQDCRGAFDSEGVFRAFMDGGWGPDHQDGYETCEWILAQPWSDGKIGSIGGSARGITQNMLAGSVPPGLTCQSIGVAASNMYSQAMFGGGAYRQLLAEGWTSGRGPEAVAFLHDVIMAHPNYDDEFWGYLNFETRHHLVNWPIVNVGGWYDIFLQGTINNFVNIQHNGQPGAQGKQKLIIEPYGHGYGAGGFYWPVGGVPAAYANAMAWLNHWMKGVDTGVMVQPPVCYYVLGDVDDVDGPGNEWRFADDWPVPATEVRLYFHEGGGLDTAPPGAGESADSYVYDPTNPAPTLGGANLSGTKGPYDQRTIEARGDVILFTSDVLSEYVEITGKVRVRLHAASTALDTDFTAKLCDVYPDGRSMLVCDGIIRARHRDSMRFEELMTPGTVYEFEVDLWETCIAFNAGHRIRVAVSSSNYPRFDANPNTGEPFAQHTHTVPATNTLHHDAARPSHILLRVTGPDTNADGLPNLADLDADGMADEFEWPIVNASTADAIAALADVLPEDDFDGDGRTNRDEYLLGTDPLTPDPGGEPGLSVPLHSWAVLLAAAACAGVGGSLLSRHLVR